MLDTPAVIIVRRCFAHCWRGAAANVAFRPVVAFKRGVTQLGSPVASASARGRGSTAKCFNGLGVPTFGSGVAREKIQEAEQDSPVAAVPGAGWSFPPNSLGQECADPLILGARIHDSFWLGGCTENVTASKRCNR